MNYITIDKDDILEAIENEPLMVKEIWKSGPYLSCAVCAVGSVIRAAYKKGGVKEPEAFGSVADLLTDSNVCPADRAEKGNYLSALSILWESLHGRTRRTDDNLESDRQIVLSWAEENIPEDYSVDVPLR